MPTIQEMAKELGFNRCYISTQFSKETGIPLKQYIQQRKIEEAKRMLVTSSWSIQRIADALGYTSQAYFCAAFQKQANCSPSDFQRHKRFLDEGKY